MSKPIYEKNTKLGYKLEIERLKEDNKELGRLYSRANNEFLRLYSIIKEVREYITSQKLHKIVDTTGGLTYEERKLLEILDKVEGDKE